MKNNEYQKLELLPNSLIFGEKNKKEIKRRKDLLVKLKHKKNESYKNDNNMITFDQIPFVIPSKRIVIDWPLNILRNLKTSNLENGEIKYNLDDIEIYDISINDNNNNNKLMPITNQVETETETETQNPKTSETKTQIETETQTETETLNQYQYQSQYQKPIPPPTNPDNVTYLKLKSMQIFMMGGYATKYFFDKKENSFQFKLEISKNQQSQVIKAIHLLEKDNHLIYNNNNNNYEYRKFIYSQIKNNQKILKFKSQQYKVKIFKLLNLKIPVQCNDKIYLNLKPLIPINSGNSCSKHQLTRAAKLLITRQNLSKLTKEGAFQILLEICDHYLNQSSPSPPPLPPLPPLPPPSSHSSIHPTSSIGYILLTIQKS